MVRNWYILIPKWHLRAFCNAAKPALSEASDDINFSLFPEVCRKLKCRKRCGKKLKLHGGKKRKIDRKRGFNRTACTEWCCPLFCTSTYAQGKITPYSCSSAIRNRSCMWQACNDRGKYTQGTELWDLYTKLQIIACGQTSIKKSVVCKFCPIKNT